MPFTDLGGISTLKSTEGGRALKTAGDIPEACSAHSLNEAIRWNAIRAGLPDIDFKSLRKATVNAVRCSLVFAASPLMPFPPISLPFPGWHPQRI